MWTIFDRSTPIRSKCTPKCWASFIGFFCTCISSKRNTTQKCTKNILFIRVRQKTRKIYWMVWRKQCQMTCKTIVHKLNMCVSLTAGHFFNVLFFRREFIPFEFWYNVINSIATLPNVYYAPKSSIVSNVGQIFTRKLADYTWVLLCETIECLISKGNFPQ